MLIACAAVISTARDAAAESKTDIELVKNLRKFCNTCSSEQSDTACDKCERRREKIGQLGEKIIPALLYVLAAELKDEKKPTVRKAGAESDDDAEEFDEINEYVRFIERSRKPESVDAMIKLLRSKGALSWPSYAGQLDIALKTITGAKPTPEKAYLEPQKLAAAWESWWQKNRANWHPLQSPRAK